MDSIGTEKDQPRIENQPEALPDAGIGNAGDGDGKIRCPLCGWAPGAADRWMCTCRHSWHTFDTGGVCPNCLRRWESTQCLACHKWSPHSDWYPKS